MDESTLNDLLECSVCLERLDTSSKVLPCQHTFCRKCLEVILSSRQELRCPECRVLVDIKIDDLPPNVLLMRILEGMKNAKTQQHQQQQQFKEESSKLQNDNKIENTLKLNEEQQQQIKLKQQQLLYYQQQQNKQKQQLQILHQQQQQKQMQQSQQQHTANATPITGPLQQQRRPVPHAFALYDFESNESSDLHFRKGDIILLKRKVDINWYVGELNGVEGTFPTNYVQVVVPLPSPQCIALYDFKMGPNEEEGCLTFKKATLIHVLRRVDHNWAEGRIGSTIGIFPIAFVELNPLAKQLLDSFVVLNSPPPPPPMNVAQFQQQSQEKQNTTALPPQIPANQQATANNLNNLQQHSMHPAQQPPRNLPPIPIDANATSTTAVSSPDTPSSSLSSRSSSSQTTSGSQTNSTCSSTSSSLPSSPNQSNPTSPQNSCAVRYRDYKDKRHSFNALVCTNSATSSIGGAAGPSLSIVQSSNRHSAEILSIPSETINAQNGRIRLATKDGAFAGASVALQASTAKEEVREQQQQQQPPTQPVACTSSRANVLKTTASQQNVPPSLPWGYLALYPYKPRKADELELKKGCVYVVNERCLDGWFKGKNWQDTAGVFPGNYVTPLRNRDQQQLMHQWKYVQNQTPTTQQQSLLPNMSQTTAQNKLHVATASTTNISHHPPELPPRQSPSSSPVNATINSSSVWSKPLGQTVEAFFTRKAQTTPNEPQHEGSNSKETKDREKQNSTPSASCAAVSLMKRLTHMKTRSKSPNNVGLATVTTQSQQHAAAATYSMDNPSFEDAAIVVGTAHMHKNSMHPVHVRSGSCPSQLLQSLPADLQATAKNNEHISTKQQHHNKQHNQQTAQAIYGGSQRLKGCKERPQLSNTRQPTDGTMRGLFNSFNNSAAQQQQQFTKCSRQVQQQQNPVSVNNITIQHRKSQSLDANIIPGQMIQGNSNHNQEPGRNASYEQNARESRFRCIVSYPPNSELELDLNVGDVIYVHRKQKNGWYKGTHARTNKTGLFPASFVEPDI